MAGGTWISQNKVRPGAYLNFTAVAPPAVPVGDRGIATLAMPLDWGAEGALIDVYSTDLADGSALAKVGVTAFDKGAKLLNLMLSGCYLARVYRSNGGGAKATADIGGLTATARCAGVFGNEITVVVSETDGVYTVETFVKGAAKDRQTATEVGELADNDFVAFSGDGPLTASAGEPLSGGTNGTATADYADYLSLARRARWQTMAVVDGTPAPFAAFANDMRNGEGKYVQVVVSGYPAADGIATINSDCGVMMGDETITAAEATAWVAGITAGASIVQSNVGRVFAGATRILNERTNAEVIAALEAGTFILSTDQRGNICVEDDINSLRTYTADLSADMRLNQVVRVMDEVGTSITDLWEQGFKGKVQNNTVGRNAFKATLLGFFKEFANLGAIDNFAGAVDIMVEPGVEKSAVVVTVAIQPVAAMSKLYMTVFVA